MSSRALRNFAARAVPLIGMVIFRMTVCGLEAHGEAAYASADIDCTPADSSAVSLEVANAWVEGDALFADLLVLNHSESAIRLPRVNACRPYWEVTFRNYPDFPNINVACAGVFLPLSCSIEGLLAEKDIETIAPGQTGVLPAVNLGQFWSDPRKPESHVRWFEVSYSGWSKMTVFAPTAEALKRQLPETRARLCSLLGGMLTTPGHVLIP